MRVRIRATLLILLVMSAVLSAMEAARSLQPVGAEPPTQMLTALFGGGMEEAPFYLRSCEGFVAVYEGARIRSPQQITDIETAELRLTDRAMLEKGIPVADEETLLSLLEDLGS